MPTTADIARRIAKAQPGWVFTPFDFLDLGSPQAVGMVLLRLLRRGQVRRVARGVYDVPRQHPRLGLLLPTADAIAHALARREGATIQPAEALAANLLRLTEQVPAQVEYETDGRSRTVKIGQLTIRFRGRTRRKVGRAAPMSSLVFSALRSLRRANVSESRVAHLRKTLSAADRKKLLLDLPLAPAWMHPHLRGIAGEASPLPQRRRRGGPKRP